MTYQRIHSKNMDSALNNGKINFSLWYNKFIKWDLSALEPEFHKAKTGVVNKYSFTI